MNKLQIVTDKICELNGCGMTIREAEVLMALGMESNKPPYTGHYTLDNDGEFLKLTDLDKHDRIKNQGVYWQLGKPLSSQSPETIEFLFNVLNCEG